MEETYQPGSYSAVLRFDVHRHALSRVFNDLRVIDLILPLHDGYVYIDSPVLGNHTEVMSDLIVGERS
jgi:hypothetical protein